MMKLLGIALAFAAIFLFHTAMAAFPVFQTAKTSSADEIAYGCPGVGSSSNICVWNMVTLRNTAITNGGGGTCLDDSPKWSPDGARIVFERNCAMAVNIFIVNSDGSGLTQITTTGTAIVPAWTRGGQILYVNALNANSPPSTQIFEYNGTSTLLVDSTTSNPSAPTAVNIVPEDNPAESNFIFACGPYGPPGGLGDAGIQICTVPYGGGTSLSYLTDFSAASSDPHVSSDGTRIIYDSNQTGNLNIFSMGPDGSGQTQLTTFVEPTEGQDASINKSNTTIAFEHDNSSTQVATIWLMNSDGTNQRATGITCTYSGCDPTFHP